jgi:hypothetical protein
VKCYIDNFMHLRSCIKNVNTDQQIREDPRKWHVPEVRFRSIPQPAKSASEKPTRSSEEEAEYQIPNLNVYFMYLKIR